MLRALRRGLEAAGRWGTVQLDGSVVAAERHRLVNRFRADPAVRLALVSVTAGGQVWGVGCGVWDLGCGGWGVGCGVWGVGFGVWGLGFGVWDLGFRWLTLASV